MLARLPCFDGELFTWARCCQASTGPSSSETCFPPPRLWWRVFTRRECCEGDGTALVGDEESWAKISAPGLPLPPAVSAEARLDPWSDPDFLARQEAWERLASLASTPHEAPLWGPFRLPKYFHAVDEAPDEPAVPDELVLGRLVPTDALELPLWAAKATAGHGGPHQRLQRDPSNLPRFVIDVGANFGFFSIYLAKVLPTVERIYALEPSPVNFRFLAWNVRLQNLSHRIVPLPLALSEDGLPRLMQPDFSVMDRLVPRAGLSSASRSGPGEPGTGSHRVALTMRWVDLISRLDLMGYAAQQLLLKLDCEGCEWELQTDTLSAMAATVGHAVGNVHLYHCGRKDAFEVPISIGWAAGFASLLRLNCSELIRLRKAQGLGRTP